MTPESAVPPEYEAIWHSVLTEGHRSRYAFLPSSPRCAGCMEPFAGIGGRIMALMGHRRSRKNPNFCNRCDDVLPAGGAEVDIAVLFADIRGSTALAEQLGARAFAQTMNRFYSIATDILIAHRAMLDKMVGDEVMALFIPSLTGLQHRRLAGASALALIQAINRENASGIPLAVGVGVHAGTAFVGKVGTTGVSDFTALGDTVNTAARLQAEAAAGEVVVSEEVYRAAPEQFQGAESRTVSLRGKTEPLAIRVFRSG